ncbi:hypothetical protein M9434_004350 [Picochlorum sp. BPE23]|nr:hypothetical protein M9434_004350 [Picochlorum sp. BPE23]
MSDTHGAPETAHDPKMASEYIKGLRGRVEEVLSKQIDVVESIGKDAKDASVVRDRLNAYIGALESLYTEASSLHGDEVEVPLEVVQYVDDGGNPDECMRHIMSAVLRESQRIHGKKHAIEVFEENSHP